MRSGARSLAGLLLVAAGAVAPLGAVPAQAVASTCQGLVATIEGTTGDDVLIGTQFPDVIAGLSGDDQISGREGDDVVCGGDGADLIIGSDGDDRLFGELDAVYEGHDAAAVGDRIAGGPGDDFIDLGYDPHQATLNVDMQDTLLLNGRHGTVLHLAAEGETGTADGQGHDLIVGQRSVTVLGTDHADRIWGSPYDDDISSGKGQDEIRGLQGDDSLYDGGSDPQEADRMFGGPGNDNLASSAGRDHLDAGADKDSLSAGPGATMIGGAGDDAISYARAGAGCVTVHGANGRDRLSLMPAKAKEDSGIKVDLDYGVLGRCGEVGGIEWLTLGAVWSPDGNPTWRVRGTNHHERVDLVGTGRLVADLRGGNDRVLGGNRNDKLDGGLGTDAANARRGKDTCVAFEERDNCEVT